MILAYKAFNPDMTCRDFQYKCGRWYEQYEPAKLCKKGFHACILPQHVFKHYPTSSIFSKVLLDDVDTIVNAKEFTHDSKICGRQIYIFPYTLTFNKLVEENAAVIGVLLKIKGFSEKEANRISDCYSPWLNDSSSILTNGMWFDITRDLLLDKDGNKKITVEDLLKRIEEEQRKAGLF